MNKLNSSNFGVVLVFGISGVGKSTACASYVARHPTVLHVSAGALLQDARKASGDVLRKADAESIRENQTLLAAALARFRSGREDADVLIDSHSVIDNDQGLVEVPIDAVSAMRPDGMILIEAAPDLVLQRRAKDDRSRPARTIDELQLQMNTARKVCEMYARELGIPLEVGTVENEADLDALLHRMSADKSTDRF